MYCTNYFECIALPGSCLTPVLPLSDFITRGTSDFIIRGIFKGFCSHVTYGIQMHYAGHMKTVLCNLIKLLPFVYK